MKKLLIVGALLVAGPAWAGDVIQCNSITGQCPDLSTVRPMHVQNNLSIEMGNALIETHPIHLPQSLFVGTAVPVVTTDVFRTQARGKDCVITIGGDSASMADCTIKPGAVMATDPLGAVVIRRAQ